MKVSYPSATSSGGLRVEQDGSILRIVFDHPPVNAVSSNMYESLISILTDVDGRSDIDVVLLASVNDKIFCAGADVRELLEIVNSDTNELDERRQLLAREAYDRLVNLSQPTIAVLGGIALGAGAVLAACCDIRVGSTRARIGLAEVNVARCGGARHLMRILPQGVVRRMYFTAQPLDAEVLLRYGVFTDLHEPGTELAAAVELARVIASKSPYALRIGKRAFNACESLSLAEGYPVEQGYTLILGRSDDAKEAATAFLHKREPVWVRA